MVDVLAATGLLLCVVAVCSPLHRSVRRLCNPTITTWTIQQLPLVAAAQFYSNRLLDVAVLLSAATITLEVYLTLIPVLIWSGKAHEVIAGLLPQLALSGYVVFAIKDLLESPRPGDCRKAASHVEVTVRDPSGDIEDGVPSAHCCGAVSLLYYGIHAATAAGLLSPQHRAWAQAAAAVWVVWLAWGRAYLGLHSPLDLATGTLLGWALLRLWVSVEQPYAAWLEGAVQQHQPWWWLSLHVLAASAVLMRCYPMPSRWTSCYNYATAWAAGWAGATVGWGILQQAQLVTTISGEQEWLLGGLVPPLACKIFLGLGMVAASKVIVKALLMAVFTPLFAVVPLRVRCAWQPPVVGTVKQPLQQEQSSAQRLSGYASALLHKQQDGGVDAAAKQGGPSSSSSGNNSSSSKGAKAGGGSSKPVAAALSGLRHTPEGVGNDVVAAARWFSYFAVGLTVSLWQAMWPVVINTLAPPRAFAA